MGPLFIKAAQRQRERFEAQLEEVEARARSDAEGLLEQELTKVVTEAESSATVAAEEAYLGMLCDFCDRLNTDEAVEHLPSEPSSTSMSHGLQVKLKATPANHGAAYAEGGNDPTRRAPGRQPLSLLNGSTSPTFQVRTAIE